MNFTDAATGLIDTALNYPRVLMHAVHNAAEGDVLAPVRAVAALPLALAETVTDLTTVN